MIKHVNRHLKPHSETSIEASNVKILTLDTALPSSEPLQLQLSSRLPFAIRESHKNHIMSDEIVQTEVTQPQIRYGSHMCDPGQG